MEIGIQIGCMGRFKPEERIKVLRRRGERGAAFNMSMSERSELPGLHERKILGAYLVVSAYVRPTMKSAASSLTEEGTERVGEALSILFRPR